MKRITVYADFDFLSTPQEIGILGYEHVRGKDHFVFEYSRQWLKQHGGILLSGDLMNVPSLQHPRGNDNVFGFVKDSFPDRWGRLLLDRRERLTAQSEGRPTRMLTNYDYLIGIEDFTRMGGIRYKEEDSDGYINASDKYPLLEKIICKAQDVPNVIGTKLQLNSEKDVTLVVPCGKGETYTAATAFANPFTTIEEGFVYDVTLKQTEGGTIAYTKKEECNEIELTATPDEGYEFVKWNDENTDATRTVAVNSDIEFSATFQVKPTGFENVQRDNVQCTKVIRNGQLVILRDGKVFNALGAEMK